MSPTQDERCQRTRDTLALGSSDASHADEGDRPDESALLRAKLHLSRCPACQSAEQTVADTRAAVLAAHDRLDDLTRRRVLGKLAGAIEAASFAAADNTAPPWWRNRRALAALIASAAAAVLLVVALAWRPSRRAPSGAAARAAAAVHPRPARSSGSGLAAKHDQLSLLTPLALVEGSARWTKAPPRLGQPVRALRVPAGVGLRVALAKRARLTLLGPMRLVVDSAEGGRIVLSIDGGALLGDYDARRGGTLRIRSPGAVTSIVGTVFLVEVRAGYSRVSVARGKVRVRHAGGSALVRAAQSYSVQTSRLAPLAAPAARLFASHAPASVSRRVLPADSSSSSLRRTPARKPTTTASAPTRAARRASRRSGTATGSKRAPATRAPRRRAPRPRVPVAPEEAIKATSKSAGPPASKSTPPTAAQLSRWYRRAEGALKRRDRTTARALLTKIVAARPATTLGDAARYDLALLLASDGEHARAAAMLARLARGQRASRFRSAALQALVRLHIKTRACARAAGAAAEYVARYPRSWFSRSAKALVARCRR